MASDDDIRREALDWMVGEAYELAEGTLDDYLEALRECHPDVVDAFRTHDQMIYAADAYMDSMGMTSLDREKGMYLGNIIAQYADMVVSMKAEEFLCETAEEIEQLLESELDITDFSEVTVLKENPYGSMVHTSEYSYSNATLFVYHIEEGCQCVVLIEDIGVYLLYFPDLSLTDGTGPDDACYIPPKEDLNG